MSNYRIFETDQFVKDIETLARSGQGQVLDKLRSTVYPQLRERPHYGPNIKKLKAFTPETWRYRIGSWRFFFEIDEGERIVFLTAATHRGAAY